MSNPTLLVASAGAIAIGAGLAREGHFPDNGMNAVLATGGLIVVASALGSTPLRPVVSGFAWLLLIASVYSAVGTAPVIKKAAANRKGKTNG